MSLFPMRNVRSLRPQLLLIIWLVAMAIAFAVPARAQGNYEIQVYGSDTVAPKTLMAELHSNFTPDGQTKTIDGVYPTNHQEHETVELTEGLTSWSEVGFYIFTSEQAGHGVQWVGDHIRPRVRVPDSWHWPVGASLSMEMGYQRAVYSPDTWTWEIRPIVDKQIGPWYMAVNPALERAFHGLDVHRGVTFSPAAKVSYDVTKKVALGFEYYGDVGPLTGFDAVREQQQAIMPALDLNLGPNWEFNLAAGIGMTQGTDHMLVKMIIGRRLKFGQK